MEYLQYLNVMVGITTEMAKVLNLIINGIPSILIKIILNSLKYISFKPYYKWNTFNTVSPTVR